MTDATFPLTPALSPRERENHSPSRPITCDWFCQKIPGKSKSDGLRFPLPDPDESGRWSEGQGEGKRDHHFTSGTLLLKLMGETLMAFTHDR